MNLFGMFRRRRREASIAGARAVADPFRTVTEYVHERREEIANKTETLSQFEAGQASAYSKVLRVCLEAGGALPRSELSESTR